MFRSTPPLQEHLRPVAVRDRPQADVDGYLDAVERRLRSLFGEQRVRWQHRYPQLGVGFDAVESFVLNGGKRLRPRFAYWGWVGAAGSGGRHPTRSTPCRSPGAHRWWSWERPSSCSTPSP
ncbi:MAG: hypothetical protein R2755_05450 [Acidimicrobiales bacterium]